MLCDLQEFSSPNRDLNMSSVVKAWSLNHWTSRELPPRLKKVKNTMHCVLTICVCCGFLEFIYIQAYMHRTPLKRYPTN